MLYVPSVFGESLMDDWMQDFTREFDDSFFGKRNPLYGKRAKEIMRTDVKEHEEGYELDVDLPGFKKDEIQLELNQGYLTITAEKGLDKDTADKQGKLIRQERYAGVMTRSFFVGEALEEEDIKAKFEDGVLHLYIPKKEVKPQVPEKKRIMIEG